MAIRKTNTLSGPVTDAKPSRCSFCGQPLANSGIAAEYQKNLNAYEATLANSLRRQIQAELQSLYEQKEKKQFAELTVKADEKVRKQYDRRVRQMELSNQNLQRQLDMYKRRLEQLSSANRGSFNEEDLLAMLKAAFPQDRIERIKAGPAGRGDILHEVRLGSGPSIASGGCIAYECKDTARWDNGFLAQAKAARDFHRASYGVVVTGTFPASQKAFAVIDDVLVVDAACMVSIVHILRSSMLQLASSSLSTEGRRAKGEALFGYLAGEDFQRSFHAVKEATELVEEGLVKERRQHDLTWAQRQTCYRKIEVAMVEILNSITTIIDEPDHVSEGKLVELPA